MNTETTLSLPVEGMTCASCVGRVEKALAKEDPATWKKINATPERRAHFEQMVVLTKEQRKTKMDQWKRDHPAEANVFKFFKDNNISLRSPQEKAQMKANRKATMERVKATCSQF